jgi:putative membrane protein
MKLQSFALISAVLAAPMLAARADAPRTPKNTAATTVVDSKLGKLSDAELQVLAHLHRSDMLEVKTGKLAMEKSDDTGVKSFGKMLVDEHGADARMILSLVGKHGQTLPDGKPVSEADAADLQLAQQTMAKLAELRGKEFDREFLRAQVAMHDKTLAKLDQDIATIKDNADLVSMLRNTRPVIVKHRDHAQTLLGHTAGGNEQARTRH